MTTFDDPTASLDSLASVQRRSPLAHAPGLDLGHGARAELAQGDDGARLQIFGTSGDLILEFDPQSNRTRLCPQGGPLELSADEISLNAKGALRLTGGSVSIHGHRSILCSVAGAAGKFRSLLRIGTTRTDISTGELSVVAGTTTLTSDRAEVVAEEFQGRFRVARVTAKTLETVARSVFQKARNVYRKVEGLLETKAGRQRTLVDGTVHLNCRRALMRSTDDFKVKADRIHLG